MKGLYYIIPISVKLIGVSVFIIVFFSSVSMGKEDLSPDVAIVVEVSGNVTYQNESEQQEPLQVQAFMRLCQNDLVILPPESQVKLTYLKGGRQETWQGQVVLKMGETESQVQGKSESKPQPQVETLPNQIRVKIIETMLPFPRKRIEHGAVKPVQPYNPDQEEPATPSPSTSTLTPMELTEEELAEIEAAKETYAALKKQRGEADVTPELYLLSVFAEYELHENIKEMVGELLQKYPENLILKQWEEWVKERSE